MNDSGIALTGGDFNPSGGVEVKAQTVGLFACDSQNSKGLFKMNGGQTLMGMNSGSNDGLTSTNGLSQAGFAAAQQTIAGKGPDAAVLAANGALTNASKAQTVTTRDGRKIDQRANPMNAGDRVVPLH